MEAVMRVLYEVIESSLVTSPMENLASSAESWSPLWNLMSSRRMKVHFLASGLMIHSLAAPVVLSTSPASLVPVRESKRKRMYAFPKANSCQTLGVSLPRSVRAMTSLPVGCAATGTVGALVGAGTLVGDDPPLGTEVGDAPAVGSAEEPQATATTNMVAVNTAIRNGTRNIPCLAISPSPIFTI